MSFREPNKVIFLLPSLHAGGAEGVVKRLAEALSARGFDVSVATLDRRNQLVLSSEIEVVNLSKVEGTSSKLKKLLAVPKQLISLFKLARENRDAVFISFLERPIVCLGIIKFLIDIKAIASFRNHTSTHLKSGRKGPFGKVVEFLYKKLLTITSLRYEHLDFLSYSVQDDFFENFAERTKAERRLSHGVIYNGYDIVKLNHRATEGLIDIPESFFEENFVCTSIGRITEQKGQLEFLPVVVEVVRANPKIKFVFVGQGPDYDSLKLKAEGLGLKVWELGNSPKNEDAERASVILTGHLENPFPIMKKSSLFVFPSKWEGFGNALIESLSLGVPALSADCPVGPREILNLDRFESFGCIAKRGDGGFLLPLFHANCPKLNKVYQCWAAKILELSENEAERSGLCREAADRAVAFDEGTQVDKWSTLILKITERV